jgi:hypothetical protein
VGQLVFSFDRPLPFFVKHNHVICVHSCNKPDNEHNFCSIYVGGPSPSSGSTCHQIDSWIIGFAFLTDLISLEQM